MRERKEYQISFYITDGSIDDDMNDNINKIIEATGWTKEYIINAAFQFGRKWFLKDQLKFIVDYQLPKKE